MIKDIESFGCFLVNIHVLVFWLKIIRNESLLLLFLEHNKFFLMLLVTEMQTMHKYISVLWHMVNLDLLDLRFIIKILRFTD